MPRMLGVECRHSAHRSVLPRCTLAGAPSWHRPGAVRHVQSESLKARRPVSFAGFLAPGCPSDTGDGSRKANRKRPIMTITDTPTERLLLHPAAEQAAAAIDDFTERLGRSARQWTW